jgi:class 3 adenylate cyclase/tetratricopeptide (TPR) repeat protein
MSERLAERRVVTALFVDVVGSAGLTVQLGPERLKRTLDRAFLELKAVITAEGGTVEKYVGDAIHALFGAPIAHPDDPQRALRAAHGCARWAEDHRREPVPLAVRVGLETGEAIVDLGAAETEHQQMSVGACVNAAARLQQLAEPGQILVGATCRESTAEVAEFASLGEIELKGLGRLPVWRLVALTLPRAGARVPFVGRDAELDLLRLTYRRAQSGRSVFALVSGPPGQGKTRLVDQFVNGLGVEVRVLKARCRPAGERGARNPLQELLSTPGAEASAEDLTGRLAGLFNDATERHRVFAALMHSAGMMVNQELAALPTGQRQDEIANGWRRYLGALVRERPLVVWVDDLQWAEGEVVYLLDRLTLAAGMPALIVATARPEFVKQGGLRPGGDRLFVTLDALDETAARSLAHYAGSPETLRIARAEGNPLFIIELVRARSLGPARDVPITLQGVIGSRLDELPPRERELLQRAAIVGEMFTPRDATLLSGRDQAEVAGMLERLADLLYLHPVPGGYRFHHALVRDVAYGRLTTAERMQLHARYAQDGVLPGDAEALAHHLWEAIGPADADWVWDGSEALSELRAQALAAHLAASRRCTDRFAYERAVETCQQALRFATGPLDKARVERAIADAYMASGDVDQAWGHYLQARDLHREGGADPPPDLYPSLLEPTAYRPGMFRRPPNDALVEAFAQEGEDVARHARDAASLARLLAIRAYRSHDVAQLVEALRLSEEVADPAPLAFFLGNAAIFQNRVGEFAVARRIYDRLDAVATASGLTDRHLEFRAILALNTGRLGEAERLAEQFLVASASRGPHLRTHAYREQCHVLLARGDWRGLRELAAETERLVAEHPDTAFCYAVTTALGFAVVAYALEGQSLDARTLLTQAETPMQAEPFERESVLLLAFGVMGERDQVERLRERAISGFWFFRRMEAVVLTIFERWDELGEVLRPLERLAVKGNPYLEALVSAIHEEMAAARGGQKPAHRMLRELGYLGWSQLLAYRASTL